jgi:hypothetical protein
MLSKEMKVTKSKRVSSRNVLVDAPVILYHWKLK